NDDFRNQRILVIDDNEAIHQDYHKVLATHTDRAALDELTSALLGAPVDAPATGQYIIDSAFQGEEGRDRVRAAVQAGSPYAVAFVDMRMPPGWDGLETTERLWREDPDIQIVICTAYSDYSWDEIIKRFGQSDRLLLL